MTKLASKFTALETAVNSEILERKAETHTAVLALLSNKHHFTVGPPGVAKTLLVERIVKRIGGLGEGGYFRWLLTRYSVPEELFGGPNFKLLSQDGIYKRVTEGKLPVAKVAFVDEAFKANASILNSLLTIMNERQFFNCDDDPTVPLVTLFAASNELPQSDELWALWDRLHFRHEVRPLQESSSFIKMLTQEIPEHPETILTLDDIYSAHDVVRQVVVPDDVLSALRALRDDLSKEGVEPTERRWKESISIIQAEAFMNGREIAEVEDVRPLMHVLWSDIGQQNQVKKIVLQLANPIDREASDIYDDLVAFEVELNKAIEDKENSAETNKQLLRTAVEIHRKMQKVDARLKDLREQSKASNRKSELLAETLVKFKAIAHKLSADVFNLSEAGEDIA